MKKILLPAIAVAAITMTGCASKMDINHQTTKGSLAAQSLQVVTRPQEFGVDVLGDSKGSAKVVKLFGFTIEGDKPDVSLPIIGGGGGGAPLEVLAAYRAAQAKGGDAFYRITTNWDKFGFGFIYQRQTVEVTGKALKVKDLGTLSADRADKRISIGGEAATVSAPKGNFLSRLFGG